MIKHVSESMVCRKMSLRLQFSSFYTFSQFQNGGGSYFCDYKYGCSSNLGSFESKMATNKHQMTDKEIVVEEIHRPARKNFPRRHVVQRGINDTLEIDLVEMIPYARTNKGYKYLLTVIDIFSKMGYARPLKSKTAECVSKAMESVLEEIGSPPKNIHSDQGKEFYGSWFQKLMKKYNINHYHTYSGIKGATIERFNRSLKTWMWKMFNIKGHNRWIEFLPELMSIYNNHYHRTIKMRPVDVNAENENEILMQIYYKQNVYQKHKFKVGDKVRISKQKRLFAKGYEPNWSTEVFTVKKVQFTSPVTYILKDENDETLLGCFYEYELQKTRRPDTFLINKVLQTKGNKVKVSWLGFPPSSNSWIDKKSLTS